MEIDPFSRNTPESSSEDKTDDESSSKKKKKSKRLPLFNSEDKDKESGAAEQAEDKKAEASAEPLWRRILGQPEEDKKSSDAEAENDAAVAEESTESEVEPGAEQTDDAELEYLSEDERLAVAQAYIDARQAELLQEQTEASEADDERLAIERAADISLLENMRRFLRRDANQQEQIDEQPIERAFEATVDQLGFTTAGTSETPTEVPASAAEAMPLPPEVTLRGEQQPEPELPVQSRTTYTAVSSEAVSARSTESYQSDYDTKRKTGSALLVGGLVGYAIGRRRGRIKTEKRLKAVEQKLTKQVESVQQVLVQKEQQIRTLAREHYTAKSALEVRPLKREVAPKIEKKPLAPTELLGLVTLKAVEAPRRAPSPETVHASPEKAVPSKASAPEKPKPVAALSRSELLVSAAEVSVGATNLRRVFETNLISEQGLRRLLEVDERGGNVRESLEREIVEKEMSYERDPRLRNRAVVGSLAARQVVRADIDRPTPPAPIIKADDNAASHKSMETSFADKQKAHTQKTAAAAVVTLLVVIAVLLVILFNSR